LFRSTLTRIVPDCLDYSDATAARFSRGAETYLRLWAPVLRPHAVRLLDALPLADARRVLDLGTGVGALLPDIARAAPHASLVGVDIAPGMLALAPKAVPVAAMDAASLAFRPGTFDAALMVFVLFLLPEPIVALAEVRRALRAGGVLGIATWAGEPIFPALEIWFDELASLGFPPARWPTLTASEKDLSKLLASSGFTRTRTWSSPFLFHPDLESFVELRAGLGKVWLDALAPRARSAFLERVRRRLSSLSADGFANHAVILYAAAS